MSKSKIEWTQLTWNLSTGCTAISAGCTLCYAKIMSQRLKAMGQAKYANGFKLTLHEEELMRPYQWSKPRIIFVNSMSDLFHKDVPDEFIHKVFAVMNDTPHQYQVLTKRPERAAQLSKKLKWTPNIWMGTSIEDIRVIHRIDELRKTDARIKFLSCEPLIGAIPNLDLRDIHWLITGGESGPKNARPIMKTWVTDLQKQCRKAGIPFFFKQWGKRKFNPDQNDPTMNRKGGHLLNGKEYFNMPH